ncbi:MAG: M20/M25/M40 family metallo-hydrolase [Desulfovibrionaceae bacterium]|nr:M20/M25/M40 family metallo-hydrolase [Desulfovibrionaceae bacterium]
MRQPSSSSRFARLGLILLTALIGLALAGQVRRAMAAAGDGNGDALVALARVDIAGDVRAIPLPVHAVVTDGRGVSYALVLASADRLHDSGVAHTVLDQAPAGTRYLLGVSRDPAPRQAAARALPVLHDDGRRVILRDAPGLTASVSRLGLFPRPLRPTPLDFAVREALPGKPRAAVAKDPRVEAMIDKVTNQAINDAISDLSGERQITVDDEPYTITTRHTASGTPIEKATEFIREQVQALGLTASFHDWTSGEYSGRNVIGVLPGVAASPKIVLMVAHLDSTNDTTVNPADPAPGADDDGSGCAALLASAAAMKNARFENTIQFVFTTGEENGLLGSAAYAKKLHDDGENVVAVVNLDMIAYSTQENPIQNLHTRAASDPTGYAQDMEIANLFIDVVNAYGLSDSLMPVILSEGNDEGDHYSFWENQFPAIMAIEDDNNFNPNYHCNQDLDLLKYLNLDYATANTKAALGTAAHLAVPLSRPPAMPGTSLLLLGED